MRMRLTKKRAALVAAGVVLLAAVGTGAAIASSDDDASDRPIPGSARDQAEQAALTETGGGTVTGTEVDDEESKYEVEVTMGDGRQVDVQLDEQFTVVSSDADREGDGS